MKLTPLVLPGTQGPAKNTFLYLTSLLHSLSPHLFGTKRDFIRQSRFPPQSWPIAHWDPNAGWSPWLCPSLQFTRYQSGLAKNHSLLQVYSFSLVQVEKSGNDKVSGRKRINQTELLRRPKPSNHRKFLSESGSVVLFSSPPHPPRLQQQTFEPRKLL